MPMLRFCVQKHDLCIQIDALALILCVQNHNLCVLDAMTCSGYNAEYMIKIMSALQITNTSESDPHSYEVTQAVTNVV